MKIPYIFYLILVVFLIFLRINFEKDVGDVYFAMTIAVILFYFIELSMDKIDIPLNSPNVSWMNAFLWGLGGYIAFTFISSFIFKGFSTSATTPVLAGDKVLNFFSTGLLIPIVENMFFFGLILEKSFDAWKEQIGLKGVNSWLIVVFVAAVFAVFHLTIKTYSISADWTPLAVTFLFGIIQCVLTLKFRDLKPATVMHATSNMYAVAKGYLWI